MLAWHFVGNRLRDGRPVPPDGEVLRWDKELVLYNSGLHASTHIIDALERASGPIVCRVRCGGEMIREDDKLVCRERTILWRLDATDVLDQFARREALDVAHRWTPPEIVIRYLKTGDRSIRKATANAIRAVWDRGRSAAVNNSMCAAFGAASWVDVTAVYILALIARSGTRDTLLYPHEMIDAVTTGGEVIGVDFRSTSRARCNSRLTAMVCAAHRARHA